MRIKLYFAVILALFVVQAKAQLAGTLTVPGTYTSIADAITDLNLLGVGPGGVTVNIAAGYTETTPVGGFTLTATGTAGNPIVFQKNGAGANPLVTAYTGGTGTPGTAFQDGLWRLVGSDYVTINGIDLYDPNTTAPGPTMEFGYGLLKAGTGDGCQFNTIKNCTITLNRANNSSGTSPATDGSRGIDVVNALTTAHNAVVTVTAATGANSDNTFSGNTIQNCNIGVALIGFAAPSPFTLADMNNTVSGNTIINYGGGGTANPAAGIRTLAQYNITVSNNLVNNNDGSGVNHATTLRGIYLNTAVSANSTIMNNTVTVNSGATSSNLVAIENVSGATAASNTINIAGNKILNCSYTTVTSGAFYGIYNNGGTADYLFINNNLISGLTLNATNSSGSLNFIYSGSTIGTGLTIQSNTIQNMTNLNTIGTIYNIYNSNGTNSYTVQANVVNNVARSSGMSTGTMYGFYNNNGLGAGVAYIINNSFTNLVGGGTGSTTFNGINHTTNTTQTCVIANNTISAVTNGTSSTNGILFSWCQGSSITSNAISNISAGGAITGINISTGTAPSGLTISSNTVSGLITTGAFSAIGISHGTGVNSTIQKNKIYDITSNNTTGTAYGINIGAISSGSGINVNNNYIGDIKAPSTSNPVNAVVGINMPATSTNAQSHVYYNTIYLNATSTGANFGTSGIMHTTQTNSTTAQLFLRNNIIINNSTPNGTGIVVAYRRSTATLNNFNIASDNNNFYVTAGPSNYLYYDGTNMFTTLASYQSLVAPRDANSISENTPFSSLSGPSTVFLHVDPSLPSLTESGAVNIAGITDDYDNDIRQGNPGYTGSGSAPDIGADEYNQSLVSPCSTVSAAAITSSTLSLCEGQTVMMNATGSTTGPGIAYQWQEATSITGPYSNVVGGSGATTISYTTAALTANVYYYQFVTTCTLSSATATSNIISVTVNPNPTVIAVSSPSAVCAGSSATLTASGANTYSWTSVGSGASVIVTPTASTTYTVEGTDVNGCMNVQIVTVNTNSLPIISANTSASVLCIGSSATLTASGANTYSWTSVGAGASIVVSPTITTTYTVEGTDINGCTDTLSIVQTVSPCTGIVNGVVTNGVNIYPNPSNGSITLTVSDVTKGMRFEVYDAIGKNVVNKVINANETQIDMTELANGVYSYRLFNVNGPVSQGKLIRQ